MPVKTQYSLTCNGIVCQIDCWKGTPLAKVWNEYKGYYLPGSMVTIADDEGNSKTFIRRMC